MTMPISIDTDPRYHGRLVEIKDPDDVPDQWKETPIHQLIRSENFKLSIATTAQPQLLIATCIEFRYALPIPRMYAYVIRRASGRLIGSEFSIAYVLSKGVRYIALIGHNDCGMAKVPEAAPAMVDALVNEGWNRQRADEYVKYQAARYSIGDELTALQHEYSRLKRLFKKVQIAPLFVDLTDTKLHIPKWYFELDKTEQTSDVSDEELLSVF